jgi:hypothetical protein
MKEVDVSFVSIESDSVIVVKSSVVELSVSLRSIGDISVEYDVTSSLSTVDFNGDEVLVVVFLARDVNIYIERVEGIDFESIVVALGLVLIGTTN